MKNIIALHFNKPCPYCGDIMLRYRAADQSFKVPYNNKYPSIDHVYPDCFFKKILKGLVSKFLIVCCWQCNNDKQNKTIESWCFDLAKKQDRRHNHVSDFVEQNKQILLLIHKAYKFSWFVKNNNLLTVLTVEQRTEIFLSWKDSPLKEHFVQWNNRQKD